MNEETLFEEALSRSPEERAAFLEQACEGRPELRAAVEALLAAHEKSGNILDRPPDQTVETGPGQPREPATADRPHAGARRRIAPQPPRPPTTARCPCPASSSRADTRCKRRSAKGAWARSGSPSRPSRSNARSRSS